MGITSDSGNKKPQGPTFSPLRTKNGQEKTTTSSLTAMTSVLQPSSVIRTVFELIPSPSSTGRNVVVKSANGTTSYEGTTYVTTVSWVSGLLQPGSSGASIFSLAYRKPLLPRTRLNAFGFSGINHGIAIDGQVALLTISATPPALENRHPAQDVLSR